MLVVERLSDARRNGHPVLAVVRGSAINQDGASNGLTAPNGPSQQRVIRAALANAGLSPSDVDVVEAHGTGTTLGDPIEAQALLATYGQDRRGQPLWLGSIKSNIGHTQAAAGVAGVIKMVMAMRHEPLPATLHVDEPTPARGLVDGRGLAADRGAAVAAQRTVRAGRGVVVRDQRHQRARHHRAAAAATPSQPAEHSGPSLPWAAVGEVRGRAGRSGPPVRRPRRAADRNSTSPTSAGRSAAARAFAAPRRRARRRPRRAAARAGAARRRRAGRRRDPRSRHRRGQDGLRVPGPGLAGLGMGRELHAALPGVRRGLRRDAPANWTATCCGPIRDVMWGANEALLDSTEFAQPALFAVEVALFRLLESWGVRPDYLIGHSIGELSAAHVAGVLSLENAAALVVARGRLMQALPEGGAMVAVAGHRGTRCSRCCRDGVDIAAVNAPDSVVISGPERRRVGDRGHATRAGPPRTPAGRVARVPLVADGADAGRVQHRRQRAWPSRRRRSRSSPTSPVRSRARTSARRPTGSATSARRCGSPTACVRCAAAGRHPLRRGRARQRADRVRRTDLAEPDARRRTRRGVAYCARTAPSRPRC